jgi:hypothetical protein
MTDAFTDHRPAAMALLTTGASFRPRGGQFLGGLAFDANPLTETQVNWLRILLEKHGLPPLNMESGL